MYVLSLSVTGPGGLAKLQHSVKNKRNSVTHKLDENHDNTFTYMYIYM